MAEDYDWEKDAENPPDWMKSWAALWLSEKQPEVFQAVMALRCANQGHQLDGSGIAHDDYKPTCAWCHADMSKSPEWKATLKMKEND